MSAAVERQDGKPSTSGLEFKLHPLVLINISDHFTRTRANSGQAARRVYGCLLGQQSGRSVDVLNSFEIKVDTSGPSPMIDEAFLVKKQEQYRQVFSKQDVVGWYTTGPAIGPADQALHRRMQLINESPVLLLLNPAIEPARKDLPVTLYESEFHAVDGQPTEVFVKAAYSIETSDAERIGVDQVAKILASGKASGAEQLNAQLVGAHSAIKMLAQRLRLLRDALQTHVAAAAGGGAGAGQAPPPLPHAMLRQVSSLVHALPAMQGEGFSRQLLTEHNDTVLTILLASMTKGCAEVGDLVDKFNVAYDKPGRRALRGGMM